MNLIGSAAYDPAAAVSKATSALLAMTAIDTTNLRLAITVPAHGKVKFILRCAVTGATTLPALLLGVLNGATVLKRAVGQYNMGTQSAATQNITCSVEFTVTGLTPGAMNVDAAYGVQVVVAATNIKYGGPNDTTGADAWGAFVFEAWDPQPLPTAAPGVANGLLIAGANAATTFASLTSTAAFSVNGVSAVSQTGDTFARVGAPAGASVSADVAAVKVDTAAVKVQTDKLTFTVANQIDSNVLDWKGATAPAMTGDAFARLGAPVGASHSADTAAVKADTAAIKTKTDSLTFTVANQIDSNVLDWKGATAPAMTGDAFARLGTPAGASVSADVAAVKVDTAAVKVQTDKLTFTVANQIDSNVLDWKGATAPAMSGDAFARIGAAGAGLTALGDTRIANLDTTVSSRSTYAGGAVASVTGAVGSVTAAVTVGTNNDKTGYALSAAGVQAIWDALTSALTTVGSVGKLIVTNLDALISSRMATYTQPTGFLAAVFGTTVANSVDVAAVKADTAAVKLQTDKLAFTVTNQIDANVLDWKSATAPAMTGDAFARLGAPAGASVSADVAAVKVDTAAVKVQTDKLTFTVANQIDSNVLDWKGATAPAMTGDAFARIGAAGVGLTNLGDTRIANLDTTVSSRSTYAGGAVASVTGAVGSVTAAVTVGTNNDKTGYALSGAGVQAIWDALTSALTTVNSVGKLIATNIDALISSRSTYAGGPVASVAGAVGSVTAAVTVGTNNDKTGYALSGAGVQAIWDALTSALTTVGSVGKLIVTNLDALISSRFASASYTAPNNADIVLIKAKTDNLPSDPADASVIDASFAVIASAIAAIPGGGGGGTPLTAAETRAALGLASANLDTQLATLATTAQLGTADDATLAAIAALPTVAQLAAADDPTLAAIAALPTVAQLAAADDATLAAIAALPTVAQLAAADDATLAAIAALPTPPTPPTPTAIANEVATRTLNVNVEQINNVQLVGNGRTVKWGPA